MYKPTEEQQTIINFAQIGHSFKVFAYAGSGKTTTMLDVCKAASSRRSQAQRHTRGLFLAFNKPIADDARDKLKARGIRTTAKTWHGLALGQIGREYGSKTKNIKEAEQIWRKYLKKNFIITDQRLPLKSNLLKEDGDNKPKLKPVREVSADTCKGYVINAVNAYFASIDDELTLDHFYFACPAWADREYFVNEFAKDRLLSTAINLVENIFNTEQPNFPISFSAALKIYQLKKPNLYIEYDYLIVDEAQDTDQVALGIINSQDLTKLQVIVVGDSYQQIYSWRGAKDALNNVNVQDVYYLSKSFRFGDDIALFASSILKHSFTSFEKPIVGNEMKSSWVSEESDCDYGNYDAIITRTNAGAFDAFMKAFTQLPNAKIKVNIQFSKLENYIDEFEKLTKGEKVKADGPLGLFDKMDQLEEYVDQNPTDSDISSPFRLIQKMGVEELKTKLKMIKGLGFKDQDKENSSKKEKYDLEITTAHKAKGLEYSKVVIFEDFNAFLFKKSELPDGGTILRYDPVSDEEVRLFYVSVTRGKEGVTLENFSRVFVDSFTHHHYGALGNLNYTNKVDTNFKNDMTLCTQILFKHLHPDQHDKLHKLLERKNLIEIMDIVINSSE